MTKQKLTTLAWAGAALVGGPLTLGSALADSGNPFLAQPLESAHTQLAQAEGKCGGKEQTEAKCGAEKDGEGKCGSGDKSTEGKCGGEKDAKGEGEGKCGEGKCGGAN